MKWYEECELIIQNRNTIVPDNIIMLDTDVSSGGDLSLIPQFFVTPVALNQPNTFVSIPTPNIAIYDYVISNISVHFNKNLVAYHNGKPVAVSMQFLKESSEKRIVYLFENIKSHPIIQEVNGTFDPNRKSDSAPSEMYTLRIKKECIPRLEDEQFDKVWNFIANTYMLESGLFSTSVDWEFGDEIRHSKFISYLSKYNYFDIYLDIDRKSYRVKMLHVKNRI